ncbi:hypothetical protein C7C46_08955 [Streptomyces tateyamensis]|uniref:DUF3168 domain-containing protein n=1 Tax=Streptomyces tateyamensis TaxID=565073 RepID=A0A2V4PDW8_9ACTN|nr:DUF3168 domain-containing protein [Streptomyces tateyamensis]PYC83451.1 hypothetical protein C7C46_08955 [Streptomyces tateyamensis]
MSTPAVLPHVDAVTAVLTTAQLTVYLGGAPQGVAPPYVVLYPDPGTPAPASLADDRTRFVGVLQATAVGATAEQALNVMDRCQQALSAPLQVTGRTSWRPQALDGQPVRRDDDVTPPVFYAVARWRLRSMPQ